MQAMNSGSARAPLSVMIFTLDEEIHLPSCLAAVAWCDDVIVVDSFSSDRTEEIARAAGVRFFQQRFLGFGEQRNWALDNTDPRHEWILILDADERPTDALHRELEAVIAGSAPGVGAYRVKRRFHMWGRWLRHSSLYPTWVVRLVRKGRVRYVNRGHAETQRVDGEVLDLREDLIDENLKGMDEWFERQNRYSTKDAAHELALEDAHGAGRLLSEEPLERRAALKRVASRLPFRRAIYFFYAYVWRLGFLDGRDGLVFCRMRALYQEMVDIKKHDMKKRPRQ
jgi:glycosyltransferase involved in cell wall biosynthesis